MVTNNEKLSRRMLVLKDMKQKADQSGDVRKAKYYTDEAKVWKVNRYFLKALDEQGILQKLPGHIASRPKYKWDDNYQINLSLVKKLYEREQALAKSKRNEAKKTEPRREPPEAVATQKTYTPTETIKQRKNDAVVVLTKSQLQVIKKVFLYVALVGIGLVIGYFVF